MPSDVEGACLFVFSVPRLVFCHTAAIIAAAFGANSVKQEARKDLREAKKQSVGKKKRKEIDFEKKKKRVGAPFFFSSVSDIEQD